MFWCTSKWDLIAREQHLGVIELWEQQLGETGLGCTFTRDLIIKELRLTVANPEYTFTGNLVINFGLVLMEYPTSLSAFSLSLVRLLQS